MTIFGDISAECGLPQVIAAGGSYTCAITRTIAGEAGTSHTNTITATASDDDGNTDTAQATETVDFTNVGPDISLTKTADPLSVPETGGEVTYTFVVTNNGAEAVDFDGLTDDMFGDISGDLSEDEAGTIPVTLPVSIAAGGSFTCYYRATIAGEAGTSHVNTATATANDGEGGTDSASDDATVDFTNVGPDISLTKTANPPQRARDRRRGHLHLCRHQQRRGGGGLRRPHRRYVRGHLR